MDIPVQINVTLTLTYIVCSIRNVIFGRYATVCDVDIDLNVTF